MSKHFGCRFSASWREGQPIPFIGVGRTRTPPNPAAVVNRFAAEQPQDDELHAVVRLARERELPTVYLPTQVSFASRVPLLIGHAEPQVGWALSVMPFGDAFFLEGWARAEFHDELGAMSHVSPGLWTTEAEIFDDTLYITGSDLIELSVTPFPSREGTTFAIGKPEPVPAYDIERLGWDNPPGVFSRDPEDHIRFARRSVSLAGEQTALPVLE